jgi:hypothetical protein
MNAKKNLLFILLISLILAACAPNAQAVLNAQSNAENLLLNDIGGIAELKEIFNQDQGQVRLVLLLAPT